MMTLANYGIGSKQKDAKVLSKSLQVRTRSERLLSTTLKSYYKITDDKRNDIFNLIHDYYSRIPFNVVIWNKYQTKQCIVDSILLLDSKFNPYKAKQAFELVEKMLINLVYLPWHKEFRSIYTYSGKFRSSISEPLIGVEEVFKAAGFEYANNNLLHLILPDDKMPQVDDGESVTSVIFDCLLAQVIINDIIEVYEKCNKTKHSDTKEVNYYSWIQAYFNERSNHTTEKACSNIDELLNNITNYLIKTEKSQQLSNFERNNSIGSSSGITVVKSVTNNNNSNNRNDNNSPKSTSTTSVQDRTREFLAKQAQEDDNLLTLPSDLLRLPASKLTSSNNNNNNKFNHSDSNVSIQRQNTSLLRQPFYKETGQQHQENFNPSTSDDILNSSKYFQRSLFDRLPSTKHYQQPTTSNDNNSVNSNETRDFVDHQHHNYHSRNSYNQISDIPHNDREPLLPNRYDKRLITHQIPGLNNHSSSKRYSLYDNTNDHHQSTSMNNIGQFGSGSGLRGSRYLFDDQYEPTSHSQSSSNYQVQRGLNNLNEYNAPSYRK